MLDEVRNTNFNQNLNTDANANTDNFVSRTDVIITFNLDLNSDTSVFIPLS